MFLRRAIFAFLFFAKSSFTIMETGVGACFIFFERRTLNMSLLTAAKVAFKSAAAFTIKHSPEILACFSIIALAGTVKTCTKAAVKSKEIIEEKEKELGREMTTKEKVTSTAKVWIPAVICITACAGCTLGSQFAASKKLSKTVMAMSGAIAAKDSLIEEMTEQGGKKLLEESKKVVEKKKASEILAKGKEYSKGSSKYNGVIDTGYGDELFHDVFTDKWFWSSQKDVNDAIVGFQNKYANSGNARISDLYARYGWTNDPNYDFDYMPTAGDINGFMQNDTRYNGYVPDISQTVVKEVDGSYYTNIEIEPDTFYGDDFYYKGK